jgi:hypothetical protein
VGIASPCESFTISPRVRFPSRSCEFIWQLNRAGRRYAKLWALSNLGGGVSPAGLTPEAAVPAGLGRTHGVHERSGASRATPWGGEGVTVAGQGLRGLHGGLSNALRCPRVPEWLWRSAVALALRSVPLLADTSFASAQKKTLCGWGSNPQREKLAWTCHAPAIITTGR